MKPIFKKINIRNKNDLLKLLHNFIYESTNRF